VSWTHFAVIVVLASILSAGCSGRAAAPSQPHLTGKGWTDAEIANGAAENVKEGMEPSSARAMVGCMASRVTPAAFFRRTVSDRVLAASATCMRMTQARWVFNDGCASRYNEWLPAAHGRPPRVASATVMGGEASCTILFQQDGVDAAVAVEDAAGSFAVLTGMSGGYTVPNAGVEGSGQVVRMDQCMQGYFPCLPLTGDLDCRDIPANAKPVRVIWSGADPYMLDPDRDGYACVAARAPDALWTSVPGTNVHRRIRGAVAERLPSRSSSVTGARDDSGHGNHPHTSPEAHT
jgi:hypothetical protein